MRRILDIVKKVAVPLAILAALLLPATALADKTCSNGTVVADDDPCPISASAQQVCEGVGLTGSSTGCTDPAGAPTVQTTIAKVINILSIFIGVVAVIMIIVGGFKYIISSGDSNNLTSAKNTILYAIVGLVFVALSQVIVRFVLTHVG